MRHLFINTENLYTVSQKINTVDNLEEWYTEWFKKWLSDEDMNTLFFKLFLFLEIFS